MKRITFPAFALSNGALSNHVYLLGAQFKNVIGVIYPNEAEIARALRGELQ